ncbi:MAG: hypothetical protein JWN03_2019 [Nocardia sp.]|nr:hypothetical protein [Nocardia sp.]
MLIESCKCGGPVDFEWNYSSWMTCREFAAGPDIRLPPYLIGIICDANHTNLLGA